MNLSMKKKQTGKHREQTCAHQGGGAAGEGGIESSGSAYTNYYAEDG